MKPFLFLLHLYLRPQVHRVILLTILLLVGTGLQLFTPQLMRRFIDTALGSQDTGTLPLLAGGFIAVALAGHLVGAFARYVGDQVSWAATNHLRTDLLRHCLHLDLTFHKQHTPGEMVERIDGDVATLANFFSKMAIDLAGNVLLLAGVLGALAYESWLAGLAMGLFATVTLITLWRIRGWAAPTWARTRQAWADFYGFIGEQLAGTEAIRSSGAEGYVMGRFYELLRHTTWASARSSMTRLIMWGSFISIFALGDAVTLGVAAYLYQQGRISLGTVYLLFHYTQLLGTPLEQIRTQLQDLGQAGGSIARVAELTATASALVDGAGAPLPSAAPSVHFDRVDFAYEAGAPVLKNVSFDLAPGAVLGVLGRTGSGKSTLARLLLRFYDPTAGEIRLGDTPLTAARLASLRSRVGLVTQDVQLFPATVRDNLTFFHSTVEDGRLVEILDEVGLDPWLRGLPQGLDTPLSGDLSAGEAQLLAFARVFLADPGLVILDEASSRLDPATEALTDRAIARLLAGRTAIIIAHRLASLERADEILILADGAVSEHGPRDALAADPGSRFHRLLQAGLEEVLA